MLQALRQSVRLLARYPLTTVAAVASLALGIGANTTIFSLIDAVVLRPLPVVRGADRLVSIADARSYPLSNPTYRDFAASTRTVDPLAAFASRMASLASGGTSTVSAVEVVSGNYFRTLGVPAALGRPLMEADDRAGGDAVVLSSACWRQTFAADPDIVGRRVSLNGAPFIVVGVAAEGFRGVRLGGKPAGWIAINAWPRIATGPLQTLDLNMRGWGWLQIVGRLRDGTSLETAQADLNRLAHRQELNNPSSIPRGFQVRVSPLRIAAAGVSTRAALTRFVALLVSLVLAVLGVACANVSGLLLARALAQRRELAIRVALGASRLRIAGEQFTDALLLSSIAAAAGTLVALWTVDLLQKMRLPGGIDVSGIDVQITGPTLAATAGLAFAAAILFAAAPAIHATRTDVVGGLKDGRIGGLWTRHWLRGSLVSVQVMLSLVLLVGTMLFARTLQTTLAADLGFEPDHVAYAATNVALERYDAGRAAAFYRDVLDRVRTNLASAVAAGIIIGLPLALILGRTARSLLYQLNPADPVSFATATLLLLAVALAASLVPAERAARTDPLRALRSGTE